MLTIYFWASTDNFERFGHEESTVTCSAMICDYEIQGDGRGSLSIFGDTLKAELKPNEEIFTSILSASSHTGTAEWGRMAGFSTICYCVLTCMLQMEDGIRLSRYGS
ncbi:PENTATRICOPEPTIDE REPEAT-CONTAINING PROTEIN MITOCHONDRIAL [Salix purpurea]|uniref:PENTATRICOPEPTIDE REPEAT-CONTAINING PROTEIN MITOCHONDRIAL n=1 Tax=Salix purpurea TaxID=77065 RepID=A0A9Q0UAY7_SALPP|nr:PENTATRICOPEPTIDE REPEAT-CONTAINING PROTEIN MITOCHONDRIAL [Salix purpurea]